MTHLQVRPEIHMERPKSNKRRNLILWIAGGLFFFVVVLPFLIGFGAAIMGGETRESLEKTIEALK